uniref:Uncharacterized protein n=1 Tax=Candidatus Kentrum sp. TUN TaxID=2126343 RepID=A0A451ADC1_9GAMM|nr:MAG: hypothetical protein BECKTUN1418D_GA0071000_12382 [Candidatus Kentron sp. TUN]
MTGEHSLGSFDSAKPSLQTGSESSVGWAKAPCAVPINGSKTGSQSSVGWAKAPCAVPINGSKTGPQAGARTGSQTAFQTASVMGTAQGAFAHPTPVMGTAQGAFAHPTPGRTFRDRLKGLILTARFATIGP